MLQAMRSANWEQADRIRALFEPLEDQRNAISPIRVLHEAVGLSGISNVGPLLPLLSGLSEPQRTEIANTVRRLKDVIL
jgi:dihydrodipicolinate synthase/N-acetylneuraminate lyase